ADRSRGRRADPAGVRLPPLLPRQGAVPGLDVRDRGGRDPGRAHEARRQPAVPGARGWRRAGRDRTVPRRRLTHRLRWGRREAGSRRPQPSRGGPSLSATIIDGKAVAARLRDEVAHEVAALPRAPGLATILVGDDPASAVYVANKRRQCVQAGMRDLHRHLPGDVRQDQLGALLDELSADPDVTGILLQLPLPDHLDATAMIARIHPDKDVDGLTEVSAGRLALGVPGLRPCTPSGVIELLEHAGVQLEGAEAVV